MLLTLLASLYLVDQPLMSQPGIRKIVEAPVSEVFVPTGFDSNDTPQVIVEGEFRNGCYDLKGIQIKKKRLKSKDYEKIWFELYVEAFETAEQDCDEKLKAKRDVPYVDVANLEVLKAGVYEIWQSQKKDSPATFLEISEAPKESQDDYTYAYVRSARLDTDALDPTEFNLILNGEFPNPCYELDFARTKFVGKTKRVIEVLPVMEKVRNDCDDKKIPFVRTVRVTRRLDLSDYLFHVRIRGGRGLNLRVNMKDLSKQSVHRDPLDEHEDGKNPNPAEPAKSKTSYTKPHR